jgi:hypothetical protein
MAGQEQDAHDPKVYLARTPQMEGGSSLVPDEGAEDNRPTHAGNVSVVLSCLMRRMGESIMRIFQIVVFVLASVAFLAALYYTGTNTGESLWKGGMALMIADIVCILLWPTDQRKQ